MTICLHIFTEEESAKNVLEKVIPKIIPKNISFRVYSHQGKHDLKHALKTTLPIISKEINSKILVLIGQDKNDCVKLKNELLEILKTNCFSPFLVRIVCRELESWLLGDLNAVKNAFPRFKPENYQPKSKFRNVDKIEQPNKFLLKIIPEYKGRKSLPKLEVSRNIAPFLELGTNKSVSFNNFVSGIKKLVG
ncbi:DUF4276 family protein [bacterium]|nr:DUF4276 family protein [bacterium]